MTIATGISWKQRAQKSETAFSRRRTWSSRCGTYQVVEAKSKLGGPTVFYAMRGRQELLSRRRPDGSRLEQFRTRRAAERVCEAHAHN